MIVAADPRISVHFAPVPDAPAPVVEEPMVWVPCGTCWGQRVIYRETPLGYDRETCGGCGGMGEVIR